MDLTTANLKFTGGFDPAATYWVNNLYSDNSDQVLGSELANFSVTLPAYGSSIYTISTKEETVILPPIPPIVSLEGETTSIPDDYILYQNYPNPFNPSTVIRFSIPKAGLTTLKIYDILGREVKTLITEELVAGIHEVELNAFSLPSGVYFCRLQSGSFSETKKMILLR
jgi:hypothetical protein